MKKLNFEIEIAANAAKVFQTMITLETYKLWTAAFNPTSSFIGEWKKGEIIKFVGVSEDGKSGGMIAEVADLVQDKFISLKYIGIVDNGKDVFEGEAVKDWVGIFENYSFSEINDITTLKIDVDSLDQYAGFFEEVWPKALDKLKELSEA